MHGRPSICFQKEKVQSILQSWKFLEQKLLLFLSKYYLHQPCVFPNTYWRDVGLRWEMAGGSPQTGPMYTDHQITTIGILVIPSNYFLL